MLRTGCNPTDRPTSIQPLTARAVLAELPKPRNWATACPADGNLYANDRYGCCVPVADFRYIEAVLANADGSPAWKPSQNAILARYAALTGFDPVTGQPDNGTDTSADLVAFCRDGIALPDLQRVIVPLWASVDPTRLDHVEAALGLAPCPVSLRLPVGWDRIEDDLDAWNGTPGTPTDEFHRVLLVAPRVVRTWGMDVAMSEAWWDQCVVAVDFLGVRDALPALALDWEALVADAAGLGA